MSSDTTPRMQIRVRGRSFMAFVVLPEAPLAGWLAALRVQIAKAPGFFDARPVIIDFSHLTAGTEGVATLLADIEGCGISVITRCLQNTQACAPHAGR